MKIVLFLIALILIGLFLNTSLGKRIRLRISGTADEAMNKDASTVDGAKAYYNAAIAKKKTEYQDTNGKYMQMLGKIDSFEKTLIQLKKDDMQLGLKISDCIDQKDDPGAKIFLSSQIEVKDKITVLKENLDEIRKNAALQKEAVERIVTELAELEAEKEKAIFTLETVQATMALKADSVVANNEEEEMLGKVRDGVKKAKEEAAGKKIAYESSATVQQQRLEKSLKDGELDRKLNELKSARNK